MSKEQTRAHQYAGREIRGVNGKVYVSTVGNCFLTTQTNPCDGCVNDRMEDAQKPFQCDEVYCFGVVWKEKKGGEL